MKAISLEDRYQALNRIPEYFLDWYKLRELRNAATDDAAEAWRQDICLKWGVPYGMATAPGSPQTSAPPPPANSVTYGDDGELISSSTFNAATGKWEIRGRNQEPEKPKGYEATDPITGEMLVVNDPREFPVYDVQGNWVAKGAPYSKNADGKWVNNVNGFVMDYEGNTGDKSLIDETMAMYDKNVASYDKFQKLKSEGAIPGAKEWDDYEKQHAEWQKGVDERKADKQKLADLRTKMLDNLNTTPEDRVAAYAEYQKTLSDSAHSAIDPQFAKIERTNDEQANATGMFGSRAYVDTKNELTKDKLKTATDIETGAALGKEQLASNDRNFWAGMLNQIDSGGRADTLTASQVAKNTSDINNQNYAGVLGQYAAQNNNILQKWQFDQAKSASYVNAGTGLAGGLLYLYGNKSGGKTT